MWDAASNGFKVQLHTLPFIIAHFSCEKTQCADVVGGRTLQNAVTKEIDLSGSATDINVEVGTMTIGNTLEMVAIMMRASSRPLMISILTPEFSAIWRMTAVPFFASRMAEVAQAR